MCQRSARSRPVLPTIGHAPGILAPSHFSSVEAEVLPADVVVLADLSATQAREVAFSLIGACAVFAERNRVVDAAHLVAGVQRIPACRFIGVHDGAGVIGADPRAIRAWLRPDEQDWEAAEW